MCLPGSGMETTIAGARVMACKTVTEHLRDDLLRRRGMMSEVLPPLAELRESEWSDAFEQAMRNRLLFGAYRYGLLKDNQGRASSRIQNAIKRLRQYLDDSTKAEYLVDVANLCLVEFECGPCHGEFEPMDDGEHYEFLE